MPVKAVEQALSAPVAARADALLALTEDQWFDRKSVRIGPRKLAEFLVGMANADGGWGVVGLSHGEVEDVDSEVDQVNSLLQAAHDFTDPTVRVRHEFLDVVDSTGRAARLLVLETPSSDLVHSTVDGKTFLRVGDETRLLRDEETTELRFDKSASRFETTRVAEAKLSGLDAPLLANYARQLAGARSDPMGILEDRTLTSEGNVTVAGCLLFFKNPQKYLPNALIRVSRFRGTTRGTGRNQNLVTDERFEGPIPRAIMAAREAIIGLQPTRRALTDDGRFDEIPTVPEDAWLEGLVNAAIHRSYSLEGDHIHVDIYDDRIEIFSPGRFPHVVDLDDPLSIRRFARNPRIVRVCYDLRICQELGEGIRRIFDEMRSAGLRDPLYRQSAMGVTLTLSSAPMNELLDRRFPEGVREILGALRQRTRMSTAEVVEVVGMSRPAVRTRLNALRDEGIIGWFGKSAKDPRAYWYIPEEHKPPDS